MYKFIGIFIIASLFIGCATQPKPFLTNETACQIANKKGYVVYAPELSMMLNDYMKQLGIKYSTNTEEINIILLDFCKACPEADGAEISEYLMQLLKAMQEISKESIKI